MSADENPIQENSAANVRRGLDLFIAVIKKHAFYPEGNPTLEQSFSLFREWLFPFLERYGSLQVNVEKNRFVYRGEEVQREKAGERSVIFPLFRDGIDWFEFREGVALEEIWNFIRMLNRYRELRDDSENDLVTALWEADFSGIRYKAVDKFWESANLINISSLRVSGNAGENAAAGADGDSSPRGEDGEAFSESAAAGAGTSPGRAMTGVAGEGAFANPEAFDPKVRAFMAELARSQSASGRFRMPGTSEADSAAGDDDGVAGEFWKLTPEEQDALARMIAAEERRNTTRDCLDVLLPLVREGLEGADRIVIQDFVADSVRHLLSEGDFRSACDFVGELAAVREAERSSVARLAEEIAGKIAGVNVLGTLNQLWPRVRSLSAAVFDDLRDMLLNLPPVVIDTLAPMAARVGDPRIKTLLVEVIAHQAGRSRSDVSHVVGAMPAALVSELIETNAALGGTLPPELLVKLTRHRKSAVREAAAKALVAAGPDNFKAVFHLLGDPDRNIGRWLLAQMGRERSPQAERLLLRFLSERFARNGDRGGRLILECYRALGRCASRSSVEFLRDVLLRRSWRTFVGLDRGPHRVGAALALFLMAAEREAKEALLEAQDSRCLGIRRAFAEARGMVQKKRRDSDDE